MLEVLVCKVCGKILPADYDGTRCPDCGGELKEVELTEVIYAS